MIVVDPRSPGAGRVERPAYLPLIWAAPAVLVGMVVAATLVLRILGQLMAPAFLEEEVAGWWATTFARPPLEGLLTPWNGFLYPQERLGFLLARLVPADVAPLVPTLGMIAGIALVAGFLASDRMAEAIPDRRVRLAGAVGLALLPFDFARVYTTILNLHWFVTIYLVAILLASPATTSAWRIADRIGVGISAFSAPAVIFLVPLSLLRWRRVGPWTLGCVLLGAVAQVGSYLLAPRYPQSTADLPGLVGTVVSRMGIAPLGDSLGWVLPDAPAIALALAAIVLSSALLARNRLPRDTVLVLGFASAAIAFVGMTSIFPSRIALPTEGARYFVVGTWSLLLLALAGLADRRRTTLGVGILFAVGLATTFAIHPNVGPDWRCVDQPGTCPIEYGSLDLSAGFALPLGVSPDGWLFER